MGESEKSSGKHHQKLRFIRDKPWKNPWEDQGKTQDKMEMWEKDLNVEVSLGKSSSFAMTYFLLKGKSQSMEVLWDKYRKNPWENIRQSMGTSFMYIVCIILNCNVRSKREGNVDVEK